MAFISVLRIILGIMEIKIKKLKILSVFLTSMCISDVTVSKIVGRRLNTVRRWFRIDDTYLHYIDEICIAYGYNLSVLFFSPGGEEEQFDAGCGLGCLLHELGISRRELKKSMGLSSVSAGYYLSRSLGDLKVSFLYDLANLNGFGLRFMIVSRKHDDEVRQDGCRCVAKVFLRPIYLDCSSTIEGKNEEDGVD